MRDISKKNVNRFPVVEKGTRVVILDAKMNVLNGRVGTVIETPMVPRSPHKAIYKIEVDGMEGPWYLFRTEFQPQEPKSGRMAGNGNGTAASMCA